MDKRLLWLVALSVVIVIGLGGAFGFMLGQQQARRLVPSTQIPVALDNIPEPTSTPNLPSQPEQPTNITAPVADMAIKDPDIVWTKPEKINSLGLITNQEQVDGQYVYHNESSTNYYSVGKITYKGVQYQLIFVVSDFLGPAPKDTYLVVKTKDKAIILGRYSSEVSKTSNTIAEDGFIQSKITVDSTYQIPSLEFPPSIVGPGRNQNLAYVDRVSVVDFPFTTLRPVFKDSERGTVYTETERNGLYIVSPGPYYGVYKLKSAFLEGKNGIQQITWNDGSKNTTEYGYTTVGGCGSINYIALLTASTEIDRKTDLTVVGKNSAGEPIYVLKDPNDQTLKDLYDNQYYVQQGEEKMSYEKFIATRPLIFWVDPFNRLVKLQSTTYQPMAECGKPVIYLYPEKTTRVKVKVEPQEGFTYTEPKYDNGWEVDAYPNGSLTEVKTGRHYPYLFWEGRGGIYEQPKQGWVVRQAAVKGFLQSKLLLLGLNHDESQDFLDFWLPRMQAKPYYFITFLGKEMMNRLAPLTVDPQPDTVIRILMDFTPLDKPIKVAPYVIRKPRREGFTVVEWGGVLR